VENNIFQRALDSFCHLLKALVDIDWQRESNSLEFHKQVPQKGVVV
jgi:hypothetical protein